MNDSIMDDRHAASDVAMQAFDVHLSPQQARDRRAALQRAAEFVSSLQESERAGPSSGWDLLESMPRWALCSTGELRRLALVTGALYCAADLALCLDCGVLRSLRKLIGSAAMQAVMAAEAPLHDSSLVQALPRSPQIFLARSAALLLAGVAHPELRHSLAQRLNLSRAMWDLPTADETGAQSMVVLAAEIVDAVRGEGAAPAGDPADAPTHDHGSPAAADGNMA